MKHNVIHAGADTIHAITVVALVVGLAGGAAAAGLFAHDRTPPTGRSVATIEAEQDVARRKAWIERTLSKYFDGVVVPDGSVDP